MILLFLFCILLFHFCLRKSDVSSFFSFLGDTVAITATYVALRKFITVVILQNVIYRLGWYGSRSRLFNGVVVQQLKFIVRTKMKLA